MANIRINSLPATTAVLTDDVVPMDGLTTRKIKPLDMINSARPFASQPEAEAGVVSGKDMSPLTTKQAIAAQLPSTAAGRSMLNAADDAAQRTLLGLGGAAQLGVGTTAGTVAAGNDSRITGAAQKSANLSDLGSASTARTNLGLGNSATKNVGDAPNTVASGDDVRFLGVAGIVDQATAEAGVNNAGIMSPLRSKQARLYAGYRSLMDEGAVGDGATDDTAAILAGEATGVAVFAPPGVYDSTIYQGDLRGPLRGSGQVRDSDGNLRAPNFTAIDSEPARGNYGSILETFNGDLSKVFAAVEYRITGADTLGAPPTGFMYTPEATPYFTYVYNASGHNEELGANIGRTAATAFRTMVTNVGQGDCMAYNFSVFVDSAKPGATSFLANPAGSGLAGEIIAGRDGVYLNPMEINCDGGPHDVAAVTLVGNLQRNDATAALGEIWGGVRIQSLGTAEVDSAFMMTGPHRVGLDLVHATFNAATKAAITMKADDRFYLKATEDARSVKSKPSLGDSYFTYGTTANATVFVTGGVAGWQMGPTQNLSTVPMVFQPGSVAPALANGYVTFAFINNTTLQFSARGADGVLRTGNITIA